jgi:hypothetical protein
MSIEKLCRSGVVTLQDTVVSTAPTIEVPTFYAFANPQRTSVQAQETWLCKFEGNHSSHPIQREQEQVKRWEE